MKRRTMLFVATAALGMMAGSAQATVFAGADIKAMMTYTTAAAAATARTGGSYTGVGSLFVTYASTAQTGLGALCTGALVSGNAVLTAGHCLSDVGEDGTRDAVTAVTFYLPSFGERTPALTFQAVAGSWTVNAGYDPLDIGAGNDIALFKLSTIATGRDVYGIYDGDPLQQFTRVGTGTIGGPGGTGTGGVTQDYRQRAGNNLYEFYGDEVFSDVQHNVLLSDFDDGTAAHDVFGRGEGKSQRGVAGESNSSPGDSGGPIFINGKIVGVTSFGVTGAVYDGGCGAASNIDPYASSSGSCTNSSVGEISGDTWVKPYTAFINSFIAASAVPEPSTWMMMIAGFAAMGVSLRRRPRDDRRLAGAQ